AATTRASDAMGDDCMDTFDPLPIDHLIIGHSACCRGAWRETSADGRGAWGMLLRPRRWRPSGQTLTHRMGDPSHAAMVDGKFGELASTGGLRGAARTIARLSSPNRVNAAAAILLRSKRAQEVAAGSDGGERVNTEA